MDRRKALEKYFKVLLYFCLTKEIQNRFPFLTPHGSMSSGHLLGIQNLNLLEMKY